MLEYPKNSENLQAAPLPLSSSFSLPSRSSSSSRTHPPGFQPGSPSKEGGRVRPEGPGWRPAPGSGAQVTLDTQTGCQGECQKSRFRGTKRVKGSHLEWAERGQDPAPIFRATTCRKPSEAPRRLETGKGAGARADSANHFGDSRRQPGHPHHRIQSPLVGKEGLASGHPPDGSARRVPTGVLVTEGEVGQGFGAREGQGEGRAPGPAGRRAALERGAAERPPGAHGDGRTHRGAADAALRARGVPGRPRRRWHRLHTRPPGDFPGHGRPGVLQSAAPGAGLGACLLR